MEDEQTNGSGSTAAQELGAGGRPAQKRGSVEHDTYAPGWQERRTPIQPSSRNQPRRWPKQAHRARLPLVLVAGVCYNDPPLIRLLRGSDVDAATTSPTAALWPRSPT